MMMVGKQEGQSVADKNVDQTESSSPKSSQTNAACNPDHRRSKKGA